MGYLFYQYMKWKMNTEPFAIKGTILGLCPSFFCYLSMGKLIENT